MEARVLGNRATRRHTEGQYSADAHAGYALFDGMGDTYRGLMPALDWNCILSSSLSQINFLISGYAGLFFTMMVGDPLGSLRPAFM